MSKLKQLSSQRITYVLVAAFAAAVLIIGVFSIINSGKIYPGVSLNGVYVGGLTPKQAQQKLEQSAKDANYEVAVQYNNTTIRIPVKDLGVTYPNSAYEEAFRYGRTGRLSENLYMRIRALFWRPTTVTMLEVDDSKLTPYIQTVDTELNKPVANASLSFADNRVTVEKSQPGERLDRGLLVQAIKKQIAAEKGGSIDAPVYNLEPTIKESALEITKHQVDEYVSSPVAVTAGSFTKTIDQAQILSWVDVVVLGSKTDLPLIPLESFYPAPSQSAVELELNKAKVEAYAQQLAQGINREPVDAQLTMNNGSLGIARASQDGLQVDTAAASKKIVEVVVNPNGDRKVVIPTKVTKAAIREDALAELGIKEMISEGVSYFPGSPPERMQNVRTGQAKYNGVILKPGEVFSFGKILGDVGPQTGYAPAKVILGNRQELQYGGGLCQVSSTAFRAALNAGLPILERVNHSFAVSYYTAPYGVPGVDATIYYPQVDFKFKNDTSHFIYIQTIMQGTTLKFQFYGTKEKEGVIRGPQFVSGGPDPKQPSRTVFYRDVVVNGQVVKTDTFYTNYKSSGDFPNKPQFN